MGLSFFFLSQEHPDFLLENYHLPLSAQVINVGQAPRLLLRGSLSPGLTNRTSKAPAPVTGWFQRQHQISHISVVDP